MEKKQNWYKNPRKYHFIYKTTCNVNGKYYFGMHSTDNLEDGYIGSGTYLAKSIRKHGRENFSFEILEFCSDRESLKIREREIVNEDMICNENCMNLIMGGGAFDLTKDQYKARNKKNSDKLQIRLSEPEFKIEFGKRISKSKLGTKRKFYGREQRITSIETKQKISDSNAGKQTGSKNSQFGKKWIYSLVERKSIKVDEVELYQRLEQGWVLGRKNFGLLV